MSTTSDEKNGINKGGFFGINNRAPPVAPAAPPAPSVVQPVDIGTQPLVSDSAGSDPTATKSEWGDEPAKFHRQLMRKLTAEGMSASAAWQRISEDYPQLIDELLQ